MTSLRVIYRSSVRSGRELTFEQTAVRVGRDPSCDVTFDENAERIVSRMHAEIRFDAHGPVIVPSDGKVVIIAGKRLEGLTPLQPGDVVELAGPGGPSFEVQFEPLKPRAVIGNERVDASARTVFEMRPPAADFSAFPATQPPPVARSMHPGRTPVATAPVMVPVMVASTTTSQPDWREQTEAWSAPIPTAAPGADAAHNKPAVSSQKARRRVAIVALFGTVATASLVAAQLEHSAQRPPVSRPAQPVKPAPQKLAPAAPEPPAEPLPEPAAAPPEPAPLVAAPDPAVRRAFALLRRAELAAEGTSTPDPGLLEQVRTASQAYDSLLQNRGLDVAQTPDLELVRATARRLGECDGAMPVGFVTDAVAAIDRFAGDADAQRQLAETVARGRDAHMIQAITDLLAGEGLPPELVLVPLDASGFHKDTMGMPLQGVATKGLWQLLPGEAKRLGLQVGSRSSELAADPRDERLQFAIESQKVAKGIVPIYFGVAGGSKLLFVATYDHGSEELIRAAKKDAGLRSDESDPEQVNYWRLYESGALSEATRRHAIDMFVLAAATSKPSRFKLPFEPLFTAP